MMTERKVPNNHTMADFAVLPDEAGSYQVPDDPNRGPIILLLVLGVMVVFSVVVFNAYKQGVRESDSASLPQIVTEGSFKTRPAPEEVDVASRTEMRVLEEVSGEEAAFDPSFGKDPEGEPSIAQVVIDKNESDDLSSRIEPHPKTTPSSSATGIGNTRSVIGQTGAPVDLRFGAKEPGTTREVIQDAPKITKPVEPTFRKPIETPPPRPAPVQTPSYTPQTSGSGDFYVQLGAVKSMEDADGVWLRAQKNAPNLFNSVSKYVQTVDLGAKGVWHRVQAGRFDSRADASDFCTQFKNRGGDCIVAMRK